MDKRHRRKINDRNRGRNEERDRNAERDRNEDRDRSSSRPHSGRYARRRARKKKKIRVILTVLLAGGLAVAGILYVSIGRRYQDVFFPNTVINGIDVSDMDTTQVEAAIDSDIKQYVLTIEERGRTEEIHGNEIDLCAEYDGTLNAILQDQNPLFWGIRRLRGKSYEINTMVSYDKEKLAEAVVSLVCLDPGQVQNPVDACLTYVKGSGYQVVPEVKGNELIQEQFIREVSEAVLNLRKNISLEELGLYKEPKILEDDPVLNARKEALAPYADITITYHFGSQREVLDGSIIGQWLSDDGQGNVILDEKKAAEYVKSLAQKYNTAYRAKQLKTSYGPTVTITSGHYGWIINQEAETEELVKLIKSHESQDREPVYSQKAASHDGPDYGDTYAELNLTAQHLYFYKDGNLLVESDFVSGDEAKGWSTPAGAFSLTYKQRNAVLKGKNYATPVSYWMPFNGNIGMHDGYWRSSFGGTIYKKNGSHGCVNLPPAVAKTIYENIKAGFPVLCYHLEGTEKKTTTRTSGTKTETNKKTAVPKTPETETSKTETSKTETPEVPSSAVPDTNMPESLPSDILIPEESEKKAKGESEPETSVPGPGPSDINGPSQQPQGPGQEEAGIIQ